ncbi:unnamed protein product [Dovyalis caffra]|uniref:DUF4408 domain-containing protein n=1 Tax=Dovyalis caffra TaxID=77055 RepID=A0AAV1R2K3_9ROSI|nr:unnamed protein product [Dovyalis caffra]
MVLPASSSGNLMLSVKVGLISTGVLSLAVMLKLSVLPVVTDFAVSELPNMYSSVLSWLQPPYLYLVINCIIISIVASSKLQLQKQNQEQQVPSPPVDIIAPPVQVAEEENISVRARIDYVNDSVVAARDQYAGTYQDLEVEEKAVIMEDGGKVYEREEYKAAPSSSDSMEFLSEKDEKKQQPLVSSRLGRRKSLKANTEGCGKAAALGVSKPKRHDTLESTWKTITDGRPMPLTRHLKKSDTWESHVRRDSTPPPKLMKKAETFNDSGRSEKLARSPQGSGKLRREPSLSQDELNKRVEAFIKKFNEEMRLQRQASLNQYQEMIGGGAY